jgi:hypothetical protein
VSRRVDHAVIGEAATRRTQVSAQGRLLLCCQ